MNAAVFLLAAILQSSCIVAFSNPSISHRTGVVSLQSPWRLYSASLEEAEDLIYYSATAPGKKSSDTKPPRSVQRVYETWRWSYCASDETQSSSQLYKINYRVEGETGKPPILLVHGFGANVNHFRYQFPTLVDAGYRVYAIDLLGFGASDKPWNAADVGFSIEFFTRQILDFLSYIQTKDGYSEQNIPWTLAGNSIGGLCCLNVAAELGKAASESEPSSANPGCDQINISSIVLFNTSGGMTGFRYEDVPFWARPLLAFVQNVVLGPTMGGYFFRNFRSRENIVRILRESGVYGDITNVDDELFEMLLEPADDEGAEQVFLAVFGGPPGPTAESVLPYVKVPVLALWGTSDPWTPLEGGMHPGRALLPYHGTGQFTIVPLEGAGHCPHDECPDRVNKEMIRFMKQVASEKTAS
jgi:pimeloyl-ACP methyl ester carboxylesterase